jgi:hypothetical protein
MRFQFFVSFWILFFLFFFFLVETSSELLDMRQSFFITISFGWWFFFSPIIFSKTEISKISVICVIALQFFIFNKTFVWGWSLGCWIMTSKRINYPLWKRQDKSETCIFIGFHDNISSVVIKLNFLMKYFCCFNE